MKRTSFAEIVNQSEHYRVVLLGLLLYSASPTDAVQQNEIDKPADEVVIAQVAGAGKSLITFGDGATPANAFDTYRALTGFELEFSPAITNVAAFIQLEPTYGEPDKLAQRIENMLKDQAGVIITRSEGRKALVTYDAALARKPINRSGATPPRLRADGTEGSSGRFKQIPYRNRPPQQGVLTVPQDVSSQPDRFVHATVQIEINDWSYWRFEDRRATSLPAGEERNVRSVFAEAETVHCVVGTNMWLMDGDFLRNAKATRWFTGTNIIEALIGTRETAEADIKKWSQVSRLSTTGFPVGHRSTRIYETGDGNPGRPARVGDLMDVRGRICWLALCSGPALNVEGRPLFPSSDRWKEHVSAPDGFTEMTTVFEDGLGLPRSIALFTPKDQLIFEYHVRQTTNVLGWNFPLEFYGVQYSPSPDNGWELQMTFKGKVTAIGVGGDPATTMRDFLSEK